MFAAWLITIGLFFIGIYASMVIMNNLKEKDQLDLAILESQFKNITTNDSEALKAVI
ncbi:hypothetical protein [Neobacillus terrae]|uniref:hypothetical protein n=1 Tax=Neobacillus terrae TaxID=3034837 RepID=UPI00140A312A|nr:hypothetical protein [Neobacillus terrae]NHM30822.1 hypothetical protein [Neobacillus terrae]